MTSLVGELKSSRNIFYSQYDLESAKHLPAKDYLRKELGVEYGGKSLKKR